MTNVDEKLSAFLDGELLAEEMQQIRDRLAVEPALAARLSELSLVDQTLQAHYGEIDHRPLPEAITQMLGMAKNEPEQPLNNVIRFPLRERLRAHTGKAIAAALVGGFALAQWLSLPTMDADASWQEVAQVLESTPSGTNYTLASGEQLTPRLTFVNHDGEYCRQFRVQGDTSRSENIACLSGDEARAWDLAVRFEVAGEVAEDRYQTASGGSALDATLDKMIAGPIVAPEDERRLIELQWSPNH
ncbi:hypothetical protein [Marinobacter litoralis]|uniref:hypothetical protein n=1 Tax=Marinobacter litoralis TaxID=187981 RepID=UPI0018EAD1FC|nr:hypothetical protein [Marinobacter litoralis]MBJ6137001.1 hypothetical protein [Marinobacter litoralis]